MAEFDNEANDSASGSANEAANPQQSASNASDSSASASQHPDVASGQTDAIDEALADLVEDLGPISKEAELLADLQRLQAEFVNYKARVERDRDVARTNAIAEVLRSLFPALDDLARAEAHGDLEGSPFAAVANKLRAAGDKFGLVQFGAKGEPFNPELHDALVQLPTPGVTEMIIGDVVEPGYQLGDRVIRAAKVAVQIPA